MGGNAMTADDLHQLNLNLHPNEASGLLVVENEALLEAHGWELAFWAVLDEGRIEDCVAIIGHRRGASLEEGWEIDRLRARPAGKAGKTEDAEAITRHDGWVYVLGSHFGSKRGPLEPRRGFVGRFREDGVEHVTKGPTTSMEISRRSFVMHRLINDALADTGPGLVALEKGAREAFIESTIRRGKKEGKRWAGLVRGEDYPLNVEGAAFRRNGNLLIGLRFPVAADGRPILVEIDGIDRLFEGAMPEVRGLWTVDAIGRDGAMAGVRDLALVARDGGEELHLVTGNVDSRKAGSILIEDYPDGSATVSTHFRCAMPPEAHAGNLTGEFVREFPTLPRVEGITITDDGRFFYVTDEDEGVHLHLTRLLTAAS
jgi:hypothetical protein